MATRIATRETPGILDYAQTERLVHKKAHSMEQVIKELIIASGTSLKLKFVTHGPYSNNIGSRLYLLDSETE
jgi:hypothetical protein